MNTSLSHPRIHRSSALASQLLRCLLVLLAVSLLARPAARGAVVVWTNGTSIAWTNPAAWSPNGAPTAANDYCVSNSALTMQSVDNNSSVFACNSVTVSNGATIYLYRSNSGTTLNATNYFTNSVSGYSPLTLSNASLKVDSSLG
jgi:hypothetical protein